MENSYTEFLESLFPATSIRSEFRTKLIQVLSIDPDFPTFPASVAELQVRLNHPKTGLHEIAEIIKLDPGLTARLIALSRSAAYGGVMISSIDDALFRLGLKETRTAIFSSKLVDCFANLEVKVDWERFWLHSLLTARLTQNIGDLFQNASEKYYLAGLLHDVGKLIFAHYFPEAFDAIIEHSRISNLPMFEAEQILFGTHHGIVGAALCEKWGVDPEISQAIQYHHTLQEPAEPCFLATVVHTANAVGNLWEDNIYRNKAALVPQSLLEMPEWHLLEAFHPRQTPRFSLETEISKARETVHSLLQKT